MAELDSTTVKVDTRVLDSIIAGKLDKPLQGAVEKCAFGIVLPRAIDNARVDTGAMKNAFYVSTSWGKSTYGAAVSGAEARRPEVQSVAEARPRAKAGEFLANVGNSVEYFIYHEMGTVRMAKQPMLRPGLEEAKKPLKQAVKQILGSVGK